MGIAGSQDNSLQDLLEYFVSGTEPAPKDVNPALLKYAIYARKSTTGEGRQERSIPDQIKDCVEKVVLIDNLNVIGKPIEEKGSAKEPDIRPKFKSMLEDVRSGRVDGIIAWHPDRLSRNMKEAGEIIDLLDKGVLKDLRFATSSFENSPTGKMLLGISFVLSKQYSEHLSESVVRGNKRKTEDGYFFDEQKHGYYIRDERLYPDPETFTLIRTAFEMRLNGASQPAIAAWLNTTGYKLRRKNKKPADYKWDKDAVSKLLRDPVYAGVLRYGKGYSILSKSYDFESVITVEEYKTINGIKEFSWTTSPVNIKANKDAGAKADLLRGMVDCGFCHKPFSSGLTPKKLKSGPTNYYYYKCETEGCVYKGKSIRARVMLDCAHDFFIDHMFVTQSNYSKFLNDAQSYAEHQRQELTSQIMSLGSRAGIKAKEYDDAKAFAIAKPELAEHVNLDLLKTELDSLNKERAEILKRRKALKEAVVTYDEYLELFKSIPVKLKQNVHIGVLDSVLKKFFSNFTILDNGKDHQQRYIISYKLNEPWLGFINSGDFVTGRG